jgi:AcrR family transcriptional regulator
MLISTITTKERILNAALELFNTQGVEAVTVRHIAQHIGISHGNLCYHFPRKEDIIYALYAQAAQGISGKFLESMNLHGNQMTLEQMLHYMTASFAIQYEYKFLMVDFVNIMRRIPEVKKNFQSIFPVLRRLMLRVLAELQDINIVRSDLPQAQFDNLIRHIYLFGDFWLSEAEILYTGAEEEKLPFFTELGWSLLVPYLTKKGLKQYKAHLRLVQET